MTIRRPDTHLGGTTTVAATTHAPTTTQENAPMEPVTDLETMHSRKAVVDELPGEPAPFALSAGEGPRYAFGSWHITAMARHVDTNNDFALTRVMAPAGPATPFLSTTGYTFLQTLEGELTLWLPNGLTRLVAGDSATIPVGTPFSLRPEALVNTFLLYTTDDGLQALAASAGTVTGSHVFSRSTTHNTVDELSAELDERFGISVHTDLQHADVRADVLDALPEDEEAFVMKAGRGDRFESFEQVNTYVNRPRHTGQRFFGMSTRGAKAPYIPLHFHGRHAENFLCIGGEVRVHINGEQFALRPGDYVHAPAGTIHSFAFGANNTQMLGLPTTNLFEKFFEYMNTPTNDYVQVEGGTPWFPAEGFARAREELDLVVVGPPPEH